MALRVHVVVPLKDPSQGKSRLAGALAEPQRLRLIHAMLDHVACAALRARGVAAVSVLARGAVRVPAGCAHLLDRGRDLNSALVAAAHELCDGGAQLMLVLAADLPFVTAEEVEALIECGEREALVAAPDTLRAGTNALRIRLGGALPLRFGPDSLRAHAAAAEAARMPFELLDRPGLACDIDEPAQLGLLAGAPAGADYSFLRSDR